MSYPIKPDFRFLVSTPIKQGTTTLKIELFQIAQFKRAWCIDTRDCFVPCLPFRHDDRLLFLESELYRVRINGLWYMESKQYFFMSKCEIFKRWLK